MKTKEEKNKGKRKERLVWDEQLGVGGWDRLPQQQQSQLKVFIKLQPLFLQRLAEPHFLPLVCTC